MHHDTPNHKDMKVPASGTCTAFGTQSPLHSTVTDRADFDSRGRESDRQSILTGQVDTPMCSHLARRHEGTASPCLEGDFPRLSTGSRRFRCAALRNRETPFACGDVGRCKGECPCDGLRTSGQPRQLNIDWRTVPDHLRRLPEFRVNGTCTAGRDTTKKNQECPRPLHWY